SLRFHSVHKVRSFSSHESVVYCFLETFGAFRIPSVIVFIIAYIYPSCKPLSSSFAWTIILRLPTCYRTIIPAATSPPRLLLAVQSLSSYL
ncbi:hypothetical protein F5H01DRAFT_383772, partial [Linnemannia elongata]